MGTQQLSLWDNVALESGYRSMALLNLEQAVAYFKEALLLPHCDREVTRENIAACIYWHTLINNTHEKEAVSIASLLSAYKRFSFSGFMLGLKKALLSYFAEYLTYEPNMNIEDMEITFDLLLNIKDFTGAENMVIKYMDHYPETTCLFYFLAQAQWQNGNKTSANDNYMLALLHHPAGIYISRIENMKLQNLIHCHGMALAPIYAWILELVPAISMIKNVVVLNKDHALAIKSLQLLREAIVAREEEDRALLINFRKQLKTENPELYAAYFSRLKQSK